MSKSSVSFPFGEPVKFVSNPPLRDVPKVVPEEVDGVVRNKVVFVPSSNRSPFEGVIFKPETMSLRAKLNLGVQFSRVDIGQIENDPAVLFNRALHLERDIYSRLDKLVESPDGVSPQDASVHSSVES